MTSLVPGCPPFLSESLRKDVSRRFRWEQRKWEYRLHSVPSVYRLLLKLYRLQGKRVIHVLHIGKTGGNVIKEALQGNRNCGRWRIELHGHNFKLQDVPDGDAVVIALRDPISRFISGFYHRQKEGRPKYYFPWTDEERKAFSVFSSPNELALALSSEDQERRREAIHGMESIEHVRTSFWDWLHSEEYFNSRIHNILLIGFQESLDEDFEKLKALIGLPETISLSVNKVKANISPVKDDKELDQEAIRNLKEWYASDIAFYRRCLELSSIMNQEG